MKVAVDAMGGDYPLNNIEGAIKSLEDPELEIFLVGEPEKLHSNLILVIFRQACDVSR